MCVCVCAQLLLGREHLCLCPLPSVAGIREVVSLPHPVEGCPVPMGLEASGHPCTAEAPYTGAMCPERLAGTPQTC